MSCQICGNPTAETRMGACWECVEAETIIEEGLDMYDKGIDGLVNNPAKSSMDKLKFLISKGWMYKNHPNHRLTKPTYNPSPLK